MKDLEQELNVKRAEIDQLNAEWQGEKRGKSEEQLKRSEEVFMEKKHALTNQAAELERSKKMLKGNWDDFSGGFFEQMDPTRMVTEWEDEFPILMFPLRLETRFKSVNGVQQLWLRVYPDDCNIETREDLLSESEWKNAKNFWTEIWKAGGVESEERAAWRSLVNSHGSGRAAWIIANFKPVNPKPAKADASWKFLIVAAGTALNVAEKAAAGEFWTAVWMAKGDKQKTDAAAVTLVQAVGAVAAKTIQENYIPLNIGDEILPAQLAQMVRIEEIDFPSYTPKRSSWSQAAKAAAMPDKFVLTTFHQGKKKTIVFPRPVQKDLAVSVDPSLEEGEQVSKTAASDLVLNKELSWMVDFEAAVLAGMAIRIDLDASEAAIGFEKIFVTGLRLGSNPTQGKQQLEDLLHNHYYSKNGFSLLGQGTPTNNTEDGPSGHSWSENADHSFDALFKGANQFDPADAPGEKSDGEKLADGLGLDPLMLGKIGHANGSDQLEAYAMNTALFPATLGYFMDEMMGPVFSEKDINNTRTFFTGFVSGRGPLPAIRIGKQPYGILPVSAFSRMRFGKQDDHLIAAVPHRERQPFLTRLHQLLLKMDQAWDLQLGKVAFVGKNGDKHQVLLDVLGLHAHSASYHQRYAQSLQQMYNQMNLQFGPFFGGLIASAFEQRAKLILQELGLPADADLPILKKFFLSKPAPLSGPIVDLVPDSETTPLTPVTADGKNYLEWLQTASMEDLRKDNFGGNPAPKALLYLYLKHALLLEQSGSGAKLLQNKGILADRKIFHDPDFIHVQQDGGGKSKFEHLYTSYASVTGDDQMLLADYLRKPSTLVKDADLSHLKDVTESLKILEKVPTARLERLFTEHMDCCSYRLDAWKTGLVQYRLTEQRFQHADGGGSKKGIYLGAYGWLMDVKPGNKQMLPAELDNDLKAIFNADGSKQIKTDSENLGYIHAPSIDQAATAAILRNAFASGRAAGSNEQFAINLRSDRVRLAISFLEGMRNGQTLSALLGYQFERGLHDKYGLGLGEADQFIYPLRRAFPLVADKLKDTVSQSVERKEVLEANNVIDGLKFIAHVKKNRINTYPFNLSSDLNMPAADANQANAIQTELIRIMDVDDAIGDLVLSEQVFQMVKGNFERAAGNADAYSKGSYPPEVDVVSGPQSGVTLTHRMAIHFNAEAVAVAGAKARAKAEPAVNEWLKERLPDPKKVQCKLTYSSPVQAAQEVFVSMDNLGLQPIDLLYILEGEQEQSMTDLDDRIVHFIRYNISDHPATRIKISYTDQVDPADLSKISFFELGALIKPLRKMILGSRYLHQGMVAAPSSSKAAEAVLDDVLLRTRVKDAKDELDAVSVELENLFNGSAFLNTIGVQLNADLSPHVTDSTVRDKILAQLEVDIRAYLQSPVVATMTRILTGFEAQLSSVTNPVDVVTLKGKYEAYIKGYVTDFGNLDKLVKDASVTFLKASGFGTGQTGTGFMHDGIFAVYASVQEKLDAVVKRWEQKVLDYDAIMVTYPASPDDEAKTALLRKAERVVSTATTIDIVSVSNFKNTVEANKNAFDKVLDDLKKLGSNNRKSVIAFLDDVQVVVDKIALHDSEYFDNKEKVNQTFVERVQLLLLKESIGLSLQNLKKSISARVDACKADLDRADATVVNTEKLSALMAAAKKVFGDDALIVPQFSLKGALSTEFDNAYGNSDLIQAFSKNKSGREMPVEDWMTGVARVREKLAYWENAAGLCNAFGFTEMEMTPLQLPYRSDDRWLALEFRDNEDPLEFDAKGEYVFKVNEEKLLYTAHYAKPFDPAKPQCGVLLDEWTELIPSDKETTGIAFHYDQPNSEPPQTMLLVVPPVLSGQWSWNDIIDAMDETLSMAKKRAVEPRHLELSQFGQFLPAIISSVTLYGITAMLNLGLNNDVYKKINHAD